MIKVESEGSPRSQLLELLKEYQNVFPKTLPTRLPPLRQVNHEIDLELGSKPPSRALYRLSQPQLDELQAQLSALLEKGLIEPSKSPFGAPVFFLKKTDRSWRLVCDWRELNRITVKNEACLPNTDDLFDTIQGSKYFTKLDLHSGYNQVRVRESDIPKTAINTHLGHFQYKVMGFGLCDAPATFMSLMNHILRPYLRRFVVVFLDDILIFSRNWEEHLTHLRTALQTQRDPSKCGIGSSEVLYMGHLLSGKTISPNPTKLEAVADWPRPQTVSQVRSFLGIANYFRRFIQHYAKIASPLDEVTGKGTKFSWNQERQSAFEALKTALLQAPVLRLANVAKPFKVHTDASDFVIGAVLLQEFNGGWHPVAFVSRKLNPAERNYTITEKETLAVIYALKCWRLYLFKHFDLYKDNQAVTYLRTKTHLRPRDARWVEFLADYFFSIHHIPGQENTADPLTRQTDSSPEVNSLEYSLDIHPDDAKLIAEGYDEDPELLHIIKRLSSTSKDDAFHDRYLWDETRQRLYLIDSQPACLCIPREPMRLKILQDHHDCSVAGHPGRDRTLWNVSKFFFWPGMGKTVKELVRTCELCQRSKSSRTKVGLLQPLPVPKEPWEDIRMDLVMGLPCTGRHNDAVFVLVDRLTKYVHLVPTTSTISAKGAARLYIDHVFCHH